MHLLLLGGSSGYAKVCVLGPRLRVKRASREDYYYPVFSWKPPFLLPLLWSSYSIAPQGLSIPSGCIALQSFLLCVCLPPIFLLLRFWQLLLLFPRDGCGIASGDICACDLLTQPRKRENSTLQRWGWGGAVCWAG